MVAPTPQLYAYMLAHNSPPITVQSKLIETTAHLGDAAEMQIPHEQAAFLTLLTGLIGARRVVEVGTFTGYSALAIALALPPDGRLITCDISPEWGRIARDAWREADVEDLIDLRIGDARETLRGLPDTADIDLVFIDADKIGYIDYWELLVPRVRPGGILLADNVFYYGEAAATEPIGNAKAIDTFNAHVRDDQRVESVMLPIADGLTIARKRAPAPTAEGNAPEIRG
jgi:caffeoyl-CoA O-methyltransferase